MLIETIGPTGRESKASIAGMLGEMLAPCLEEVGSLLLQGGGQRQC